MIDCFRCTGAACAHILLFRTDRLLCRNRRGEGLLWGADSQQRLLVDGGYSDPQTRCHIADGQALGWLTGMERAFRENLCQQPLLKSLSAKKTADLC